MEKEKFLIYHTSFDGHIVISVTQKLLFFLELFIPNLLLT